MNGTTTQVNILLHGLFFMRLNPLNNNLEVLAPKIADHHFVGGVRGARKPITTSVTDLTYLTGKQDPPDPNSATDLPGSVLQFRRNETDVKLFTGDSSRFAGSIFLPWPLAFFSLRCGDITTTFPHINSKVGASIELNARRKNKSLLGAVTLLQYTTPNTDPSGVASLQNIHYYNQPCDVHTIDQVNTDLQAAAYCFKPDKSFDLQLDPSAKIDPVDPGQNACANPDLGTTAEDEKGLDEERGSPDVQHFCPIDPKKVATRKAGSPSDGEPTGSPANCPTIFVG